MGTFLTRIERKPLKRWVPCCGTTRLHSRRYVLRVNVDSQTELEAHGLNNRHSSTLDERSIVHRRDLSRIFHDERFASTTNNLINVFRYRSPHVRPVVLVVDPRVKSGENLSQIVDHVANELLVEDDVISRSESSHVTTDEMAPLILERDSGSVD